MSKQTLIVVVIITFATLFSCATLLQGHGWGDDFALYLSHAKNISEGKKYIETGFIYNEFSPTYSPQSYPPGFPILIAPIYTFFGLNYSAYKIYILIFFIAFLIITYKLLENKLPYYQNIIILLILAFNPFLFQIRDNILSDIPAAFFLILSIYLAEICVKKNKAILWLLFGIFTYVSYSIRPIGIVILIGFFIFVLKNYKGLINYFCLSLLTFIICAFIQNSIINAPDSYLSMMLSFYSNKSIFEIINEVLVSMNKNLLGFKVFFSGENYPSYVNTFLFYILFHTALISFIYQCYKKIGILEICLIFYVVIILLWPSFQGLRFFIPLLPFYLYYNLLLINLIISKQIKFVIAFFVLVPCLFLYSNFFLSMPKSNVPHGIQESYNLEAFSFIKSNIPKSAVMMSTKPRIFSLLSDTKGVVFPDKEINFLQTITQYHVDYVLIGLIDYVTFPRAIVEHDTVNYHKVFDNTNFQLYHIEKNKALQLN